jgi:hypothetical protein
MTTDPRGPAEEPELFNPAANNYVKTVTDDGADNLAEIQRRIDEGLFSADGSNALRAASRGQGRARNR